MIHCSAPNTPTGCRVLIETLSEPYPLEARGRGGRIWRAEPINVEAIDAAGRRGMLVLKLLILRVDGSVPSRLTSSRSPTSSHSLDGRLAAARLSRESRNQAPETPMTKTVAAAVNCHVRDFTSCSFARAFTLLGSSSSARE